MKEHALVSILIPAYNPAFFETAISSALSQTWPNFEIIICDDSRDDSVRLLSERLIANPGSRIKYFKNEARLGEEKNVLRCLQEAQGKYVKFLYDDDVIYENCITRLVSALESAPGNRLASSRRRRIDENNQPLVDINATAFPFPCDVILDGSDTLAFFADYLVNFIGEPSTVLCYREDLLAFGDGLFELKGESMPFLADMAIFVKLLSQGDLAFVAEPLAAFRVSEHQSSQLATDPRYQALVRTTYTRMPQVIRELGWYKGDKEQNVMVKVAPMNAPEQVQRYNILQGMLNSTHHSLQHFQSVKIRQWLSSRTLPSYHRDLVHNFQKERGTHQTLTVFIMQSGQDTAAMMKTLASVYAYQGFGVTLHPVALSDVNISAPEALRVVVTPLSGRIATINTLLAQHSGDWVLFLEAGETILESGMLMFDLALENAAACDAIYGDEFYQSEDEIVGTSLRPDFNLDLLLSYPAEMARHWIFRTSTLVELEGFNSQYQQAWQFDYIVRMIEQKGIQCAGHLPEPLVIGNALNVMTQLEELNILRQHLINRGYPQGHVEVPHNGIYALQYQHQEKPLVSIIIPTKDQLAVLIPCITSLLEKTRYAHYEILIVDNNSETPEAQQWLAGIATIDPHRIRVLSYPHPFNYSAINNMAAKEARGDFLVLLNNDTAIIDELWLDKLLNHGLRPEVGVTGAKLLYPDGKIQHAGVIMGLRGPADHPFIGSENTRSGYMNRLLVDQNYVVVTAACMLIRKSIYEQVGGLDEDNFTVSYNDVDLCLKVREAGYLTVWTPHAVVMHEGNVSQKKVDKTTQEKKRLRFVSEQDVMYQKWLPVIASDPAYNPNLSLEGAGFEFVVENNNSWQPLHWKPLPVVMTFPLSHHQPSLQRLAWPLSLMREAVLVDGQNNFHACDYAEIARYMPSSLILQHQISPFAQEWLKRQRKITGVHTVFDLEDFLPAMPSNAAGRAALPKNILQALRATLAQVDRLVVSNEIIAESCAGFHSDIRVVPDRLSPALWGEIISQRGMGRKPRIGWAGTADNNVDLDIIHKLVSQLHDRVEWVFYGYCPPSLRPWVTEFHAAVKPLQYPRKLASLNLDLALLPLSDSVWNRHISPVRLLEYGVCGIPVICSNIVSLRNSYQATRVENRLKNWREAIEMHLDNLDENYRLGDRLRKQINETAMFTGENLVAHTRCWLPE